MHAQYGWPHSMEYHLLFEPQQHRITCTTKVITKIMV